MAEITTTPAPPETQHPPRESLSEHDLRWRRFSRRDPRLRVFLTVPAIIAGITAAEQQSAAAKAQLAQVEANNAKAQNDLQRYAQLVQKQEISQQQYDQVVAAAKANAAAVEAARANVQASQAQVNQAQSKLA